MEQVTQKTPEQFKKYEREAKTRLIEHFKSRVILGDNVSDANDFRTFMWVFAGDVYNRGDGLVFMDFNERSQKSFLKNEYMEWIKSLASEVSDALDILSSGFK